MGMMKENFSHLRFLSFSPALAGKDKPSNTTNGVTPAFFTECRHFWKISPHLKLKKLWSNQLWAWENRIERKFQNISHLSRLPLCAKDRLKPLCSQQEASIAAVWPERSRRFLFLQNLRINGSRPWISITHSVLGDVHSTASRSKWYFNWTTTMQREHGAYIKL